MIQLLFRTDAFRVECWCGSFIQFLCRTDAAQPNICYSGGMRLGAASDTQEVASFRQAADLGVCNDPLRHAFFQLRYRRARIFNVFALDFIPVHLFHVRVAPVGRSICHRGHRVIASIASVILNTVQQRSGAPLGHAPSLNVCVRRRAECHDSAIGTIQRSNPVCRNTAHAKPLTLFSASVRSPAGAERNA